MNAANTDSIPQEPTITISLSRSVPVEQYGGKVECFVCLQGIRADTTPEEMEAMLDQGQIAYSKMVPFLRDKINVMLAVETERLWRERGPR